MVGAIEEHEIIMSNSELLDDIVSRLEKEFGKGSILRPGQGSASEPVDVISTGALSIDIALGCGGIPRGRITEIYGPESAGKTTLALHIIAEAQRSGIVAAFIDVEHALDPGYTQKIGVDLDAILLSQPDSGEQALDIVEALVRTGEVGLIVLDSVAALVTKAEIEGDMGDFQVGSQARLMSKAMRKLTAAISKSNCAVVFLNQLREKVGVIFGSPEITSGGKALKFYASVRIDVRRGETIGSGKDSNGAKCKVKVVKNKMAPPYRIAEVDIMFNEGISRSGSLLDAAIEQGLIQKSGAWLAYGDLKWHGRDDAKIAIKSSVELATELQVQTIASAKKKGMLI